MADTEGFEAEVITPMEALFGFNLDRGFYPTRNPYLLVWRVSVGCGYDAQVTALANFEDATPTLGKSRGVPEGGKCSTSHESPGVRSDGHEVSRSAS